MLRHIEAKGPAPLCSQSALFLHTRVNLIFQWSAQPLVKNEDYPGYNYKLAVYTGTSRGAGTFSRVFFVLGGEQATSPVRELDDGERNVWTF